MSVRVLIVFDKFKGSLSASRACTLAARALRGLHSEWQLDLCPLTDGGDGFVDILVTAAGGRRMTFQVAGPRGGLVEASVGTVAASQIPTPARRLLPPTGSEAMIAVVEMAAASGLSLLSAEQRDPWQTTTCGTGQLIRASAELGATGILLGVGGSATNDLGLGALAALGFEFRGADGSKVRPPAPEHWERIARLEGELYSSVPPICIACDVTNPLLGPRGAAAVYGRQKGLRTEDLPRMELAMTRMAGKLCDYCGQPSRLVETPGTGAAGGLSFGLLAGAHSRLVSGFEVVSAWIDLEARISAADIILTGEGCFDQSSLSGKGPGVVAARAAARGKIVHVFAGNITMAACPESWQLHAITPAGYPLEQAIREAPELLMRSIQDAL